MRIAYADPPYLGQAKRHYGKQESFAGEVDHKALFERLYDEFPDGWALSASSSSLFVLIPMIPQSWKCRIGVWAKTYVGSPYMNLMTAPCYAWEPVIFRGGRRERRKHSVRDWVLCNNLSAEVGRKTGNGRRTSAGLPGAKPDEFCYWLFELFNMRPGDEFVDLFPGTGRVTRAWETYCQAGTELFVGGSR